MRIITFLILGIYFCSPLLLSQENEYEKQQNFISAFLRDNAATEDEKLNIQCELILIYSQYQEVKKAESLTMTSAFENILSTYRKTDSLDKSQRLHELNSNSNSLDRRIDELRFFPYAEKGKSDKPILGGGHYEKSTSCINSDFETGNYDHWSLAYASSGGAGNISPGENIGAMNGTIGNHAIMGPGAGMDGPSGGNIPRVYPGGGQYSFRLGDVGISYNAAKASYTFTVTPATELFLYHFAVVLEDDGHSASEQPFMKINLIVDGVRVPCGDYHQAASGSAPGYSSNGKVRYKPWETVSIALTPYMGQTATIEMITADCSQGGHFGYAYIDAECMAMPNLSGATLNCLNPTVVLEGPPGATTYVWTGPGIVGSSSTQNITVNAGGTYNVNVIPVQGIGCSYSLETTVSDQRGFVTAEFDAIPNQICLGEVINFQDNTTMTSLAGALATSNWQFGDGNNSSAFEPSHTYTTPGIYTVELSVETSENCTNVITKDVTVSPIPVADFSIDSVCLEINSTLQNLSTVLPTNGDQITSWDWNFGDGQTSTLEEPTLLYGSENLYDITLNIESNNGCTNSITRTSVIYPNPVVDFSSTEVCLDFENSFTDLSTVSNTKTSNSVVQWNWDFGDGSTSTLQNPRYLYANHGTFDATLIAETNKGCSKSITKPVIVYELPTADFNFTNACDNEAVLMESTAVPNEGTITDYYWDINNNNSIEYGDNQISHTYSHDGFHTVMHIVKTSNSCRDTITKQITVYTLPHASFNVDAVCEDATTTFENTSDITPVDNDLITNYLWVFGEGNSSTTENPTHNYGSENVYNAQLLITTNYGCKDSITHRISVYPLPAPDFTPTSVCLEDNSEFLDLSFVSNNFTTNSIISWTWDFGDGRSSRIQNPKNEYETDGTFQANLSVETNHGCIEEITKTVTVHPLPEVSFTGINLEGCSPVCPVVTSTTIINAPSTIASYDWTLSDGRTYKGPVLKDCYHNETGNSIFYGLTLLATSNEGCVTSHTESNYIEIFNNPVADFYYQPNKPSVIDTEVEFFNTSLYADTYEWTFGNQGVSTETNPVKDFSPEPLEHIITLIANTMKGCSDTIRAIVEVEDKIIFYIPNTFTPDNDNFNETFKPIFTHGYEPLSYTLYIFNRWGEIVFESHDTEIGWNGVYGTNNDMVVKEGTYIWKIIFKETMSDKRHTHSGHVNLLR